MTKRIYSDEYYVLNLCDELLGKKSKRQYTFDFLQGDGNPGKMLPVDAYYPDLKLVIEYRELQHTETVKFFDGKQTVSGVSRGKQRRIYDQRRRDALPKNGIALIEISYSDLAHDERKKLLRTVEEDKITLRRILSKYLSPTSNKGSDKKGRVNKRKKTAVKNTQQKTSKVRYSKEVELERIKRTRLYRFTHTHRFLTILLFGICPIGMLFPICAFLESFMCVEAAIIISVILLFIYVFVVYGYNANIQYLEQKVAEKAERRRRIHKQQEIQETWDDYTYYCPICGSLNFIETDDTHFQCIDCGYTWYKPIDF